jgi:hypothetical protein
LRVRLDLSSTFAGAPVFVVLEGGAFVQKTKKLPR